MITEDLIKKYAVAVPRYTSYPTVPYWGKEPFNTGEWISCVKKSFANSNLADGISIYIHLPFCESLCTYCGCNTRITKNHTVETPYINAVLKEWALYKAAIAQKPLIKELHLGGGTPTFFSAAHLKALIEGILNESDIHEQAEFSFEAHPANTTAEHLETLFALGFRRLSLGIQDFDPKVQFIINRLQSFEQVKTVTAQARKIGYTSINFDLIYGLPLQTQAGLADTIDKVAELMPDRIAFYSYAHVPWIKPGQRKFTEHDLPGVAAKAALYELGRNKLKNLGYVEIGMDHFALRTDSLYHALVTGNLHRNFMGYTHQYTQLLIGLGVSAISDTWFGYAQNAKKLEDYLKLINESVLPVVKGHYMTAEDQMIRKHMLEIMCKGTTTWNFHHEPFLALFDSIERLYNLANDGLITLDSYSLQVTPAGKRFLRNICMAFDARLWAEQPATQLFSMAG